MLKTALCAAFFAIGMAICEQDAPLQPPTPSGGHLETRPPPNYPGTPDQPSQAEQRGTEDRPAIVKILPAEKSEAERSQEQQDRLDKASADRWMIRLTGALAIVGVLQFAALIVQARVFFVQARALRDSVDLTRKVASQQERDMHASITEANRAATAMEGVAAAMTTSVANTRQLIETQRQYAKAQMRAYLSVIARLFIRKPGEVFVSRPSPLLLTPETLPPITSHRTSEPTSCPCRLRQDSYFLSLPIMPKAVLSLAPVRTGCLAPLSIILSSTEMSRALSKVKGGVPSPSGER